MRWREFIALLGSAAAWPCAVWGQQPAMPVVGFLSGSSLKSVSNEITAFQDGLKEVGFLDGRNVRIEYRWAEQHYDQLPALANELVAGHCCDWRHRFGACGQGGNIDDPNRIRHWRRSGPTGHRR
jgi:hypothetical protein